MSDSTRQPPRSMRRIGHQLRAARRQRLAGAFGHQRAGRRDARARGCGARSAAASPPPRARRCATSSAASQARRAPPGARADVGAIARRAAPCAARARSSSLVEARSNAPTAPLIAAREALLEAVERDQPVAVAVLVAGLARRMQLRLRVLGRCRGRAAGAAPPMRARLPGRERTCSSSRGMKRASMRRAGLAPAVSRGQTNSSAPPAASTIWPSSARRRTIFSISFCSASTSDSRTGPRDSRSSRSVSAARVRHVLEDASRAAPATRPSAR